MIFPYFLLLALLTSCGDDSGLMDDDKKMYFGNNALIKFEL